VVLLSRLRHENILHLLDFPTLPSPDFRDVLLVLPYMHADLHKIIRSGQELTDKHMQAVTCQILRGLAHLHACGVAHRDLKPGNVLLNKDCKVKISDFGLARGDMQEVADDDTEQQSGPLLTEYVVTRWYRAPEILQLPQRYTSAVDVWSVGCILGEMACGKALFPGKNHVDMLRLYSAVRGSPLPEEVAWLPEGTEARQLLAGYCPPGMISQLGKIIPTASPSCLDLIHRLLGWDPTARPSASDAQEHEYLRCYLPQSAPQSPEVFDWSFDCFKPTSARIQERLYVECARLHPEMIDRDYEELEDRGFFQAAASRGLMTYSQTRDRTPPVRSRTPRGSFDKTAQSERRASDISALGSASMSGLTPQQSIGRHASPRPTRSARGRSTPVVKTIAFKARLAPSATCDTTPQRGLASLEASDSLNIPLPVVNAQQRSSSGSAHSGMVVSKDGSRETDVVFEEASPRRGRPGGTSFPPAKSTVRRILRSIERTAARWRTPTPRARLLAMEPDSGRRTKATSSSPPSRSSDRWCRTSIRAGHDAEPLLAGKRVDLTPPLRRIPSLSALVQNLWSPRTPRGKSACTTAAFDPVGTRA
jgi:hypothetical protein